MNKTSLSKLETCRSELQKLARAINERFPIQVICGHRNELEQAKAYETKMSRVRYPKSKHNKVPSDAMDLVPDPDRNAATLDWGDIEAFEEMCRVAEEEAAKLGYKIRLGRDFSFKDMPHVEWVGLKP